MPKANSNELVAVVFGTLGGWLVGKLTNHGITNSFIDKVKRRSSPASRR